MLENSPCLDQASPLRALNSGADTALVRLLYFGSLHKSRITRTYYQWNREATTVEIAVDPRSLQPALES
jgi:hypothetical protein